MIEITERYPALFGSGQVWAEGRTLLKKHGQPLTNPLIQLMKDDFADKEAIFRQRFFFQ